MCNKVLTISIAAYNAENYLNKCLDSFLINEIIDKLEVLVIDDGSTDNTAEIASKYVELFPDTFKLISKKNGGHGSTINVGIQNAMGEYFKIVDSDDWVERDGLIKLVNFLENEDVDLTINSFYIVKDKTYNKKLINTIKSDFINYGEIIKFDNICDKTNLAMHAITFKTKVLKEMNQKIDENCFYVDVEYILYPIKNINSTVVFGYPIYDYLLGTDNQSMNKINLQKRRNQHKSVCMSLINFYKQTENKISENKKLLIKKRITSMIMFQYCIYLTMKPSKKNKKEIVNFDKIIKQTDFELYNYVIELGRFNNSGFIKLVGILRRINFLGYDFIIFILQKYKIIK